MRLLSAATPALVLFSFACKTTSESPEAGAAPSQPTLHSASAPSSAAPVVPVPAAFAGPLTVDRVASAQGVIQGMKPYGESYGKLVSLLGPPTKTVSKSHALVGKKQDQYQWAASDGHTCAVYFAIQIPDVLGGPGMLTEDSGSKKVEMPAKVAAVDFDENAKLWRAWDEYAKCLTILGQKPGLPPDDPKGQGPKATITKPQLDAGLADAPSKWIGKKVTVTGTYESISRGQNMLIGVLGDPDPKKLLRCKVPAGSTPPEQKAPKAKITVTGTVNDPRPWGEEDADLIDCKPAP